MAVGEITVIGDRVHREAAAIQTVGEALDRLAPHERLRVVTWAVAYIGEPGIASDLITRPLYTTKVAERPFDPEEPF